ncbi:MAG: hypothetical protein HKM24_00150 [Gammaproteobacteria bacterium]|nr:hypothetical protein [Gammaproteobacteria bacterium]
MNSFAPQWQREQLLLWRDWQQVSVPMVLFLLVVGLFAIGGGSSTSSGLSSDNAVTIIWVSFLLAVVLANNELFQQDFQNGCLEQSFVGGVMPFAVTIASIAVRGIYLVLALLIALPVAILWLGLSSTMLMTTALAMLIAAPAMLLFAAFGASLALGSQHGAWIMALIVLPLLLPIMLFGIRASQAADLSASVSEMATGPFYLLAAASILAMVFLPIAITYALRWSLES